MCKISIIIPVYNVERYLRKCLDSCINQTFKDIEIIVVNDCSPDNSDVIMREYEKQYPDMVKCIYLDKNVKQGGARNRGLKIARGEYIMFVDSDDWIGEDMCEKMYKSAINNHADLVICDYYRVFESHKTYIGAFSISVSPETDITAELLMKKSLSPSPWNKMIKKSIIEESKCFFPENAFYEDLTVTLVWYLKASVINYVNQPLYNYFYNNNSVTNQHSNVENKVQHINAIIQLINNFEKTDLLKKYKLLIGQFALRELYTFFSQFLLGSMEYLSEIDELIVFIKQTITDWENCLNNDNLLSKYEKQTIYQLMKEEGFFYKLKKENSLLNQCSDMNDKISVWGNGVWGRRVINYLKLNDINPICIIDSNVNLHGTYTEDGIPICSLETAKEKCKLIIVAIKGEKIYGAIKEAISSHNLNIQIRSFEEFLTI